MGKKIRINNAEPCFCGSGKKFKECCKNKIFETKATYSDEVLSNPNRINAILQARLDETDFKTCFYPDTSKCKLPIKNAHTLQNNGVLSIIAENNHVMVTDVLNKVKKGSTLKKISKNKATTFYGFCEYHDSYLFQDIELKEYANEDKQNFLYAYRMVAQECHKKQRVMVSLQNCIKDNPSILQNPFVVENYRMQDLGRSDIIEYMELFNNAYMSQKFDILHNFVYKFEDCFQFAVTTMYVPSSTLSGKKLINIYSKEKERLPSVFLSVIPNPDCSYFILSCLNEDYPKIKDYVDEIENLTKEELKRFLNWTLPMYSENIVLSPKLWNLWNAKAQREYEMIVSGIFGDFEKILNQEIPFENPEEILMAFKTQFGLINMKKDPKYDLFLIANSDSSK